MHGPRDGRMNECMMEGWIGSLMDKGVDIVDGCLCRYTEELMNGQFNAGWLAV